MTSKTSTTPKVPPEEPPTLVYGWGDDYYHQILPKERSDPTFGTKKYLPVLVTPPCEVSQITCGYEFTIILSEDGRVFTFGNNGRGQLGTGKTGVEHGYNQVQNLSNVVQIAAAKATGFALTKNRQVYAWGGSERGLIFTKASTSVSSSTCTPSLLDYFEDKQIVEIVSAQDFAVALSENGEAYVWGDLSKIKGSSVRATLAVVRLPNDEKIVNIYAGSVHGFLRSKSGNYYGFGANESSQLGFSNSSEVPAIFVEGFGNLYPLPLSNVSKMFVCGNCTFALCGPTIYAFGSNSSNELTVAGTNLPTPAPALKHMAVIDGGSSHILGLGFDNRLYSWGGNSFGCLGLGSEYNKLAEPKMVVLPYERYRVKKIFGCLFQSFVLMQKEGRWAKKLTHQFAYNDVTISFKI